MTATLLVDGGGTWAHNVHLRKGQEAHIGRRADNEIRIGDLSVSARHATIKYEAGGWQVIDNKTSNGTLVNGMRIGVAHLRNGDVIRIGKTEIVFKDKESEVPEDVWGRTSLSFMKNNDMVLERRDEAPLVLPGISDPEPPRARTPTPRPAPRPEQDEEIFSGFEYKGAATDRAAADAALDAGDMRWVSANVSKLLGELSAQRGKSKEELYELMLTRLCEIISAENGFLMIPNRETKRWIIESFVGLGDWEAAGENPSVPLTVANQAHKSGRVVSNAMGMQGPKVDYSASMIDLQVHAYMAVPLSFRGKTAGVLYFDTRRKRGRFNERDAELIKQVGAYVLELENQLLGLAADPASSSSSGRSSTAGLRARGSDSAIARPAPQTRGGQVLTEENANWLFKRPDGIDALEPPPAEELPSSVEWGSGIPTSSNDVPWPDLLDDQPPSRPSIQLSVKSAGGPSRREGFSERLERLRGHEFVLLLPVDKPIRMKAVVALLMTLENLTQEQAERTIVERKGIIADRLTFSRAAWLYKHATEHYDQCVCVAVGPEFRPRVVAEPRLAELGEIGLRYQAFDGTKVLNWGDVRLLSCGRLDRKPCIDLFALENQTHVRLRHGILNLGDLVGKPNADSNLAASDILAYVKHKAVNAVRAHTVRNVLSGKTPKPQKFQSEKDYADYNLWLLMAHFAETVSLEEIYLHSCAVS